MTNIHHEGHDHTEHDGHMFVRRQLGEEGRPAFRAQMRETKRQAVDVKHIDEQLTEIYENHDGSIPDMKTFERRERRSTFWALVVLLLSCVFLGTVAWIGFFVWPQLNSFSEQNVIVSLSGPESVASGHDVHYRLRYRNAQSLGLSKVTVEVRYPSGFTFSTSTRESANNAHNLWNLGSLAAGDSGYIDISGTLNGNIGDDQSLRAFFTYTPTNFNADFQKVAIAHTQIQASPVILSITGPDRATQGADTVLTISVKQASPGSVPPLVIDMNPGRGFVKKSSDPASEPYSQYRWRVGDVANGERKITVRGVFTIVSSSNYVTIPITAKAILTKNGETTEYTVATTTYTSTFTTAGVGVQTLVGGTAANSAFSPGELLSLSVLISNNGTSTIHHVVARLLTDAPATPNKSILRWADIEDAHNGTLTGATITKDVRRGTLVWTEKEDSELEAIAPGHQVRIDIRVPVKNSNETNFQSLRSSEMSVTSDISFTDNNKKERLSSEPHTVTMSSDTELSMQQKVDTTGGTESRIVTWQVKSPLHNLTNMQVTTDVYGNVGVDPAKATASGGTLTFDAKSKTVMWSLTNWPGTDDTVSVSFPIVVNARNSTQTMLTSKVMLHATDSSGQEVNKIVDGLSMITH